MRRKFVNLGEYSSDVAAVLASLKQRDVVGRIWRKDHTVWNHDPKEIANRLGWLAVTELMSEQASALTSFAEEIRDAGFRSVILLGMGGSSLGPEVLRQTFGSTAGYPKLTVLDSVVPDWVQSVSEAIDPASTLFLISSKSGGTLETISLYKYFRSLVEPAVGEERAGQNFVAITDSGTSLAGLAVETGFRRVFLNSSDIGGRFSVLSYFGLVPAALMGIDITTLLDRADLMREGCVSRVSAHENPAARLGATMGLLALRGRNKLTLVTSPTIVSLGLWVEQLLAESTGKNGKAIIPVMGEPLISPDYYGDDRMFVYLRLEGDDNSAIDAAMERIKSSGHPVVILSLPDLYDLGAEFFRWEFATAVAGSILGIHPFDQPDVQAAKDLTAHVLQEYNTSGYLPDMVTANSLADLLAEAKQSDYFVIMAYLFQTPEIDEVLANLRRRVLEKYRVATTLGYGPRLLHSVGQLHKGGPNTGLFLQITADHEKGLSIPGESYTFGVLADAQALGDLQVLQSLGRRVIRVHLSSGDRTILRNLVSELA